MILSRNGINNCGPNGLVNISACCSVVDTYEILIALLIISSRI